MRNIKNYVIAIVAFVIGCIVCTAGLGHEYDTQINELETELTDMEEKYENFEEFVDITIEMFADYAEEEYDELLDVSYEMARDLEVNDIPVPAYDDREFSDKWDEDSEMAQVFADYICDHVNID